MHEKLVRRIEQIETLLYGIIGALLIAACVAILVTASLDFRAAILAGNVAIGLVRLLEHLLLAFVAVDSSTRSAFPSGRTGSPRSPFSSSGSWRRSAGS